MDDNPMNDPRFALYERVATEYGLAMFKRYEEKIVAHVLGKDISTLKRYRKKGEISFIQDGPREIKYMGLEVAKFIVNGMNKRNG